MAMPDIPHWLVVTMDVESRLRQEKEALFSHYEKKRRILDALDSLVTPDLPFQKVKVAALCEKAGISRTQFYTYFDNINDIPYWHSLLAHDAGLDRIGISLNWREGYLLTARRFIDHRRLYNSIALNPSMDSPYKTALRHRIDQLKHNVHLRGIEITPLLAFQIEALPYLEFEVFTRWNQGQIDLPLRLLCQYQETLVPRGLFEMLDTPSDEYA